jgi:hypothetical protein
MFIVIVVKLALQVFWTRELRARYGNLYSFREIFTKLGRSPFRRWFLQAQETLDSGFRLELEARQRRSLMVDIGLGVVWLCLFFAFLLLKNRVQ